MLFMRRKPQAVIWKGNASSAIITIGESVRCAEKGRQGGMNMEVYERKEIAALFEDWKLLLEKAGKLAARLETLIDIACPTDDEGPGIRILRILLQRKL